VLSPCALADMTGGGASRSLVAGGFGADSASAAAGDEAGASTLGGSGGSAFGASSTEVAMLALVLVLGPGPLSQKMNPRAIAPPSTIASTPWVTPLRAVPASRRSSG
jgi:hypothetical protein